MKKLLSLLTVSTLFLFCGCEMLKEMQEEDMKKILDNNPKYLISVHQIVKFPRAKQLEKEVKTFSGRRIWINMNPFLHSRDIKKIELLERNSLSIDPDIKDIDYWAPNAKNQKVAPKKLNPEDPKFYDLKLYLTRRGSLSWMQLSAGFRHEKLALLIDGIFYRTFSPQKMFTEDDEYAILQGPIDETCASLLRKNSKKNYNHYNKLKNNNLGTFDNLLR